jgi:uncharacterized peroxidase-related enzyme
VSQPVGKAGELLDGVRKAMGTLPNGFATLANSPAALEAYFAMAKALDKGVLSSRLRGQLAIAVAHFNGCNYCAAAHTFFCSKAGIPAEELTANGKGQSADDKTGAALAFARAILEKRGKIADEALQSVRDAGYSDEELIEILAHVAMNSFTNYLNEVARTQIDFPLPELELA